MKIAFLTTQFNNVRSGPGRFSNYLREIQNPELEFVFFTDDISSSEKNIIKVPTIKILNKIPGYWIIRYYLFRKAFNRESKKNKFDCILSCSAYEVLFIAGFTKTPVFTMINDDNYLLAFHKIKDLYKSNTLLTFLGRLVGNIVETNIIKRSSYIISNSYYLKDLIIQYYKVPATKLFVLYKAVDLQYFERKERSFTEVKNIFFLKNDWRRGGLEKIIEALSALSWKNEINLKLAGIPPSDHPIIYNIAKAKNFTGRLNIEGLIKKETILERYHEADIFISMSTREALGVSLLEALSSGLPVIGTKVGGIPEVLDNGNAGFLINAEDSSGLTNLLDDLKESPKKMMEKSQAGYEHCKKFSKEALEKNLLSILNR